MSKILGLDLGTNSLGWAIIENNKGDFNFAESNGKPVKGVLIFPEGVKIEKGNEKSRAAERTSFRSARRLKFRRKLRKYQTLLVLAEKKMTPLSTREVKKWRDTGFKDYPSTEEFLNWLRTDEETNKNPYFFRDKYSRKKYDWESNRRIAFELGRAFYHMAQRRGFKSNRLEQSDENTISDIKEKIQLALEEARNNVELNNLIEEIFTDLDLDNRKQDELNTTEQNLKKLKNYILRVLANTIKDRDFSLFNDVKAEIYRYVNKPENLGPVKGGIKDLTEKIKSTPNCITLGQYFWHLYQKDRNNLDHKIRNNYTAREEHYESEFNVICDTQKIPEPLKTALNKAIFYQRPLKSQKGLVGKCTFESNKPRCPISRPEYEEFRMHAFINNIRIKTPEDEVLRLLTHEEKERIVPKFYRKKAAFKFEDIAKAIDKSNKFVYYKDRDAKNAEYLVNYKLNTTVSGCPLSADLRSTMGDDWNSQVHKYDKFGNPIFKYEIAWHAVFTFDRKENLKEFASEKLGLDEKSAKKFSEIKPRTGYANLSLKAINKILPWLKKGLLYSHAVFMANLEKVIDEQFWQNEDDREFIGESIGEIIDNHTDEIRKTNAVNAIIKSLRESREDFPLQQELKKELEDKLITIYGEKSWNRKEDKDEFLGDALEKLNKQVRRVEGKYAFAKVKRIDERVMECLMDNNLVSNLDRLNNLYHPSDIEDFKPENDKDIEGNDIQILPPPRTDAIKNPVLIRAMHQLRRLINELLKERIIDDKTRIHIELAREVNDANQRAAWKQWQDRLRDENEEIEKILEELFKQMGKSQNVEIDDIRKARAWSEQLIDEKEKPVNIFELTKTKKEMVQKYKLWKEQKGICLYTGKQISLTQLFDGTSFDIEHTIPRSISWDNSMMNKTVSDSYFNRNQKGKKIPYQLSNHKEILQRIEHWRDRIKKLDNEIKRINTAAIDDKEKKDRMIQKRHLLRLEHDYWKGKYDRFVMEEVPQGFKNSQITDTGLITRFARRYLSCLFRNPSGNSNVYVVNGQAVSEFRQAWGLQEEYKKKSRANHIHHCIDAVTIACMTKDKYDAYAAECRKQEEDYNKHGIVRKLNIPKPWNNFTEDVKNFEKEVLIVHTHKDNVPKQTKRKLRKRGKIQYKDKEKTQPIYVQGDTVRGSLHKETFYGAIKQPAYDENTGLPIRTDSGSFVLKKDKKGKEEIIYVVRKKLTDLNDSDISKIIDPKVREIVIKARKKDKELKKRIEELKKQLQVIDGEQKRILKSEIDQIQEQIENNLYVIPPNEDKNIATPIRKVRIKAHLNEPLPEFKKHRDVKRDIDGSEKYPYKKWIYVQNDENYCLVIYENDEKTKRTAEIIKLIDAGEYFKLSSRKHRQLFPLIETEKKGMKIKGAIKPGTFVLFYEDNPEELISLNIKELVRRLYYVRKTAKDGRATFQFHQEARNDEGMKEDYKEQHGVAPPKSLTNGESSIDFSKLPIPRFLLSPKNMKMLIERIDFHISITGEIKFIQK